MGLRKRFRYRFDNWMSRGVARQILLLALITAMLVFVAALAVTFLGVAPTNDKGEPDSFGMLLWKSLLRTLDPGTIGNDVAGWAFLFIMLGVTLSGIFVVSALIGVINQGIGGLIDRMRRGRSTVMESGHTVILGWGPKIHTLLNELGEANENRRDACVVILADRDKVEMDDDIATHLRHKHLRVVTRTGNPMAIVDLALVALPNSKSVIVLAPEVDEAGQTLAAHESDTVVLKTLLAINKACPGDKLHVVAEVLDERNESVARTVLGDRAALILAAPLISRLLVQSGRQPGLSVVYTELLDFEGSEIYVQPQPKLVGKTFRDAIFAHDTSTVIGIMTAAGEMELGPPADRTIAAGEQLIAISADDDTVVLDGKPPAIDEAKLAKSPRAPTGEPEKMLVLGTSRRLALVLSELDGYVSAGSETIVVGEDPVPDEVVAKLKNMRVVSTIGDVTERGTLETLDITSFDHVLVLSETHERTQEMADARTMVTLLHLRDIERKLGNKVPITSEILDIRNRDLATVAEADDFIVSNTLVSLMVSQLAENPHLSTVFDELFSPEGYEIYLKRATDYVVAGDVAFELVCEAALRRGEIAIGYRIGKHARDAAAGFGITVNPAKRSKVALGASDNIIVLAQS